jgi:hypothetical protein
MTAISPKGMTDQVTSNAVEPMIGRGNSESERRRYLMAKTRISPAINTEKKMVTPTR